MIVLDALQSTFTIITMVSISYYLTSKGWFNQDTAKLFSRLVVKVSLPAFMFSSFMTTFDRAELMVLGLSLYYPLVLILLMFAVGMILIRIMRIRPGRRGIFLCMFALSNTIFIGLPVNLSLFGEASTTYVLLYYTVNTIMFWTVGVYTIKKDNPSGNCKEAFVDSTKKILSPPLVAFILTMAVLILEIKLPRFVLDSAGYLGSMTTPLSMLFIGIVIHSINPREIKIDRDMVFILIGRFLLGPLTAFLLLSPVALPVLMKKVFIIEAAMPVMTQVAIVAQTYGADHRYATLAVVVTTILGMAFIPIYMLLLGGI